MDMHYDGSYKAWLVKEASPGIGTPPDVTDVSEQDQLVSCCGPNRPYELGNRNKSRMAED